MTAQTEPVDVLGSSQVILDNLGVLDLARRAGLAAGSTINVVLTCPDSAPMVRQLSSVDIRREYGRDWLYWRWNRGSATPWGTDDCGFSGNVIDAEFIGLLEERAALANVGGAP